MQSILLIINAANRSVGTPSNFTYNPQILGVNNVQNFRINKVSIPYSFYSILSQTFIFNFGGINYNINIPSGNYSAYQLAQLLQNNINAVISPGSVNITFNQNQNTFTIASTPLTNFYFNFAGSLAANYTNYSVGIQMGLIQNLTDVMTPTSVLISPYAVNMAATSNIYIRSSILSVQFPSYFIGKRDSVIQSVPIDVNAFNWIVWQNIIPTYFSLKDQTLNQIDFQFVDDAGNIMDFNGLNPVIEIELKYL